MTMMLLQSTADPNSTFLVWGVILCLAAVGLLFLEVFFPSGGVLSILTSVAVIASIVAFFRHSQLAGYIALMGYLVIGPILVVFAFKMWMQSPIARKLILGADERGIEDNEEDASVNAEAARLTKIRTMETLVGMEGETLTPLRPVGVIRIDGRRVDALAEGSSIDAGIPIVVTAVYDNQVKVRPRQAR